jgi:hypothetical protein
MKRPWRKFTLLCAPALALTYSAALAQGCDARPGRGAGGAAQSQTTTPTPSATPTNTPPTAGTGGAASQEAVTNAAELKVIAVGSQSRVADAFVAVARGAETYAAVRRLHAGLPELGADFFRTNAVAAAFLGRRNSGGYAVEIERDAGGALRVSERAPAKGALTTMALTAPFAVVSIAQNPEDPVRLTLDEAWRQQTRPYRVTSGEFTMTGGFAGVRQQFNFGGTFGVLTHKNLATLLFDLKGEGEAGAGRALSGAATGTIDDSGRLLMAQLDPGNFIQPPRRPMSAEGQVSESGHRLTLTLDGNQPAVADGFGGDGKLEADATGPAPPKRAAGKDEPM